ncbi:hypothetical protein BDR04DRAFT_1104187, partial [Suillus decipiens]
LASESPTSSETCRMRISASSFSISPRANTDDMKKSCINLRHLRKTTDPGVVVGIHVIDQ